ncbi:MAG: nucleotidyltransferase domain-containing protein [Alphaproteobacteria bacterium]
MQKAANHPGVAERAEKWVGKERPISLDRALSVLRMNQSRLAEMGVVHAGIFGSVARGEAGPESDLDVLVVLDDSKVVTIYDYCGVRLAISDLFGGNADVVERKALRPRLKDRIIAEVVDAF